MNYPRREGELVQLEVSEVCVDDVLNDLTNLSLTEQVDTEWRSLQ